MGGGRLSYAANPLVDTLRVELHSISKHYLVAAFSFFINTLFSSFICLKSEVIRSKFVVVFFLPSISICKKKNVSNYSILKYYNKK